MNNNHRITLNTNKNIIVEFTNERIIPASGLAVVGALLGKSDFIKKLNRMDDDKDFYKAALGITRSIPSEEPLRQRMDDIGDSLRQTILEQNTTDSSCKWSCSGRYRCDTYG